MRVVKPCDVVAAGDVAIATSGSLCLSVSAVGR